MRNLNKCDNKSFSPSSILPKIFSLVLYLLIQPSLLKKKMQFEANRAQNDQIMQNKNLKTKIKITKKKYTTPFPV